MRELILDPWTPLDHKASMRPDGGMPITLPAWAEAHRRRLTAYAIRQAYIDNAARVFYSNAAAAEDRREYGDPYVIVETALSSLLGDDQTIVVADADRYDPERDEPPPPPADGETPPEPPEPNPPEVVAAFRRQEWLRDWAKTARFSRRVRDAERKSLGLGDGVYQLKLVGGQVKVKTFAPTYYFPVLSTAPDDDEYPLRINFAWEEDDPKNRRKRLNRIQYEIRAIDGRRDENGNPIFREIPGPDGGVTIIQIPLPGDVVRADGRIGRVYPWQGPDEEPSPVTCYMTHAVWPDGAKIRDDIDEVSLDGATFERNEDGLEIRDLDLRLDFIPLVHIPGPGSTLEEHYGHSVIDWVLQALDDLSNNDTDLALAAGTTGTPAIAVSGSLTQQSLATYGPGTVFFTGEGGRMDVLDTSGGLTALAANEDRLRARVTRNSRMAAAALGDVDPADFASGLHLALSYGPLKGWIQQLRDDRGEKYALLKKFVQRMAMAAGDSTIEKGPTPPTELRFGSYLPTDRKSLIDEVKALREAGLISRPTAVQMMIDGGFSIADALEEVQRIEHEDFAGADLLAAAIGPEAAAKYLGIEAPDLPEPEPVPPPEPVLT